VPETITDRVCTRRVAKQTKIYDKVCAGFYVSISPKGVATFAFKYWNAKANKQSSVTIGVYDPDSLTPADARAEALTLSSKALRGIDISGQAKKAKTAGTSTVSQMLDDFITEISSLEKKPDGEMRPVLESWENVAGFLNREVRPSIGTMSPADVTNVEIACIQQTVAKRSTSGARQTRSAMKRLFAFGAEAGRPYGLISSPVHNLPKVRPEHPRRRVLDQNEIRTLWWGLDRPDLPVTRAIALGIKFELVSMLRSKEFLNARRSFIAGDNTPTPVLRVPMKFVKKRRVIEQPLNSLAVEIVDEACRSHNRDVIFSPRASDPDAVLGRSALNQALRGRRTKKNPRVGICQLLGMKDFTPHDLRRTAASLCGDLQISDAEIAKCLDHSKGSGENVAETPSVTGRVYVHSKRLTEKRAVLDALDAALRGIIGERPQEALREAA
jgi:integrase